MEKIDVIEALSALAHETRLDVFRHLVQEGPDGIPAGEIGERLDIQGNTLSFHLTRLRHAGLVRSQRRGRHIFYAANYEGVQALIGFLTKNCCQENAEGCLPVCETLPRKRKTRAAADQNSKASNTR